MDDLNKVIKAPVNAAMCTMEDIVAQFIDMCPEIYNEFIKYGDGYYMKPEEMSYCPTWYQINHSDDSKLSVTLYRNVKFSGEEYASPIQSYVRGTTYRFNGKKGQFPKLKGVANPTVDYASNSLVRICDIEAVYKKKTISVYVKDFEWNSQNQFISGNVEFVNVFEYSNPVKYVYSMTSKTYVYFQVDEGDINNEDNKYTSFDIRISVKGKRVISERLNFGFVYQIYDVEDDISIYLTGNLRERDMMAISCIGDGAINVYRTDDDGNIDSTVVMYPAKATVTQIEYSSYNYDDGTFNFAWICQSALNDRPVEKIRYQLRKMIGTNTVTDNYVVMVYDGSEWVESNNTEQWVETEFPMAGVYYNSLPSIASSDEVASYRLVIDAVAEYVPNTIYICTDYADDDVFVSIKLFGKPVNEGYDYVDGKVRYSYSTAEEDMEAFKSNSQIPWEISVNRSAEAISQIADTLSGVKLYVGKYGAATVDEYSFPSISSDVVTASGVLEADNLTDGKTFYTSLCSSKLRMLIERVPINENTDITVYNNIRRAYVFTTGETEKIDLTTIDNKDNVSYDLYIPYETAEVKTYTTVTYKWYEYNLSDWQIAKTETRELYGDDNVLPGTMSLPISYNFINSFGEIVMDSALVGGAGGVVEIPGGSHIFGSSGVYGVTAGPIVIPVLNRYAVWRNIAFTGLVRRNQKGGPSYKLEVFVSKKYVKKTVRFRIPKLGLKFRTVTIVDDSILVSGRKYPFVLSEDDNYYIYEISDLADDGSIQPLDSISVSFDFYSQTPGFFENIVINRVEKSVNSDGEDTQSEHTSTVNEYNTASLEVTKSYTPRNDAYLVEYTLVCTRSTTQFPIVVINDIEDMVIYNGITGETVLNGYYSYDENNPYIVMTSASVSGRFIFNVAYTGESTPSAFLYNKKTDKSEPHYEVTVDMDTMSGTVTYEGLNSQSFTYFHIIDINAAKSWFVLYKDYEKSPIRISYEDPDKGGKRYLINTTSSGTTDSFVVGKDIWADCSMYSDGGKVTSENMMCTINLYGHSNYLTKDNVGTTTSGWETIDSIATGSVVDWPFGCMLDGSPAGRIYSTYKLEFVSAPFDIVGWTEDINNITTANMEYELPIYLDREYYAVVSTTDVSATSDKFTSKDSFLDWVDVSANPVKDVLVGDVRYFAFRIVNKKSPDMKPNIYDGAVNDYFKVEFYGNSKTVSGKLGIVKQIIFSEFVNEQYCNTAGRGWKPKVIVTPSRLDYSLAYVNCTYIYLNGFRHYVGYNGSVPIVEHLFDLDELDSLVRITDSVTGEDVTDDFEWEFEFIHQYPAREIKNYTQAYLRLRYLKHSTPDTLKFILELKGYSKINMYVRDSAYRQFVWISHMDDIPSNTYIAFTTTNSNSIRMTRGLPPSFNTYIQNNGSNYPYKYVDMTPNRIVNPDVIRPGVGPEDIPMLAIPIDGLPEEDGSIKDVIFAVVEGSKKMTRINQTLKYTVVTADATQNEPTWSSNKCIEMNFAHDIPIYRIRAKDDNIEYSDTFAFYTRSGSVHSHVLMEVSAEYTYKNGEIVSSSLEILSCYAEEPNPTNGAEGIYLEYNDGRKKTYVDTSHSYLDNGPFIYSEATKAAGKFEPFFGKNSSNEVIPLLSFVEFTDLLDSMLKTPSLIDDFTENGESKTTNIMTWLRCQRAVGLPGPTDAVFHINLTETKRIMN